jgi:hypothetical protein
METGNNTCGAVQVTQLTRLGNNPVTLPDGSTSANGLQLLDVNRDRKEVIIQNVGVTTVYLGLGFVPSITSYSIALLPCATAHDGTGGLYVSDAWVGAIYAIGALAGGQIAITEEV